MSDEAPTTGGGVDGNGGGTDHGSPSGTPSGIHHDPKGLEIWAWQVHVLQGAKLMMYSGTLSVPDRKSAEDTLIAVATREPRIHAIYLAIPKTERVVWCFIPGEVLNKLEKAGLAPQVIKFPGSDRFPGDLGGRGGPHA